MALGSGLGCVACSAALGWILVEGIASREATGDTRLIEEVGSVTWPQVWEQQRKERLMPM